MIEFRNITLQVPRQTLLKETSLRVAGGDKIVLRGPSGCGKSSLLKCLVGAIPIVSGSVHLAGLELSAATVMQIRGLISHIGQEPVLGTERVREALLLPFTFKAHRHLHPDENQISELLGRLHLGTGILDKPCARISGGEKQRIAIARALLLNKSVFLADEITSALDPDSRTAVMHELFRPEITLLSVSHDPEWIERCDRTINVVGQQLMEEQR